MSGEEAGEEPSPGTGEGVGEKAGDGTEDGAPGEPDDATSISLPPDLRTWLEERAAERDVDLETHVRELLAAQHVLAVGDGDDTPDPAAVVTEDELEERVAERVATDVDGLRTDFRGLLEDVRDRVVQVKRETDAKASVDHDHEEFAGLDDRVGDLAEDVESHAERLDALRSDVDDGFENYESVLDHLVETTDELSDRTDRLAGALGDARDDLRAVARSVRERDRAAALKREAALEGIDAADCEACDHEVRIALLTEPRCPACEATLRSVEPKHGLFGSATFATGDDPALASGDGSGDGSGRETGATGGDGSAVPGEGSAIPDGSRRSGDVHWESTGDRT